MADFPNNTSVVGQAAEKAPCENPQMVIKGKPACVERGPVWLAELLYHPPEWFVSAVPLLIIAILVIAGFGYRRHGIDREVILESAFYVFVILGALAGTRLAVDVLSAPYWLAVIVGGMAGVITANAIVGGARRVSTDEHAEENTQHMGD